MTLCQVTSWQSVTTSRTWSYQQSLETLRWALLDCFLSGKQQCLSSSRPHTTHQRHRALTCNNTVLVVFVVFFLLIRILLLILISTTATRIMVCVISVRIGKKKNRLRVRTPKAWGDRAPKARGVSIHLGGLGECCKLPQRVRPGSAPGSKRHLMHFCLKMLYLARPLLPKTYIWWSFTMSQVVLKGPERRSGAFRSQSNTVRDFPS